jgi:hypothetical protein
MACIKLVRLLLTLTTQEGWPVHHMDIQSAFINRELDEEVYVRQPPRFIVNGEEDKVLHLDKVLYGLHQAPHAWNEKLDKMLAGLGFCHRTSEHTVYAHGERTSRLLVGVYVDDLIITGNNAAEIAAFKKHMSTKFKMSDLGLLRFYLGIEVHTEYQGLVGCLRYLVHTRPDITFVVSYVSRFMETSTIEHLNAVKCILRYVAGMITYGCHYKHCGKELELLGYSDADMGGNADTRKSTTSVVFYLGSSPVTLQSQKHKIVLLSSCEAEYIAGTTVTCQGMWLARLLAELKNERCATFLLKMDSQSAIALSKNHVFHDRSKHRCEISFHS